jgi:pSer/pThr/pTyr-binding forkhead associated (FHA) protein
MDAKLILFKADGQRKDFPIKSRTTVIGRAEDCDLRVPLLAVSRRHCELVLGEREIKVKDLASSNGTYINNQRINEQALRPGDRLVVGPVIFTVQIDGRPEEIRPAKTRLRTAKARSDEEAEEVELESVAADDADDSSAGEIDVDAQGEEEIDVISALEAMAGEDAKKKPQK